MQPQFKSSSDSVTVREMKYELVKSNTKYMLCYYSNTLGGH